MRSSGPNKFNKYYAVYRGRNPGIYADWGQASEQVHKYQGAIYKSFNTIEEAMSFMQNGSYQTSTPDLGSTYEANCEASHDVRDKVNPNVDSGFNSGPNPIMDNEANSGPTCGINTGIVIYTDGSQQGSHGGYAFLILANNQLRTPIYEQAGRVPTNIARSTNQRAELYAILSAFSYLYDNPVRSSLGEAYHNSEIAAVNVELRTDSMYSIKSLTEWARRWIGNGWKTSKGQPVENQDLIRAILDKYQELASRGIAVTFKHVPAHVGEPYNERVDLLAKAAC